MDSRAAWVRPQIRDANRLHPDAKRLRSAPQSRQRLGRLGQIDSIRPPSDLVWSQSASARAAPARRRPITVRVRYIVNDVDAAVVFYRDRLGFSVEMRPAPGFAALSRGDLSLFLNAPGAGGAGTAGGTPEPGGWNRFQIDTDDLDALVAELREHDVSFRGDVVQGKGGRQILVEDPSGNVVELFAAASDATAADR